MAITLHTLKTDKAVNKSKKRLGRGDASGHGSFSTRGIKGQRSRSGVSNLKRLGMRQQLLSVPKVRGFKSHYAKSQVVNLGSISAKFKSNAIINPLSLAKVGLISNASKSVKILSRGELTLTGLIFSGVALSESAREAIAKAGGKIK